MPVTLAPLAGYSDLPFRTLCRRFGASYCTTEMMLDRCVSVRSRQQILLMASNENDRPCAAQLIGNTPEEMARAAQRLVDLGFEVIDLNFACPVNKALRRRRGGWLMSQPRQVVDITRAVVQAVSVPVTLKVRQRFADTDSEENFWHLADGARQAGAAVITVHARSVEKKYQGSADWDFLTRVAETFADWVVIGSGDVLTPAAALEMIRQTGVDGVVAARGALGNPWFFRQVQDIDEGREPYQPDLGEQKQVLREHFDMTADLYGADKAPRLMRKHGIRYASLHPHPKRVRMAFVAAKTSSDWHGVLDREYNPVM